MDEKSEGAVPVTDGKTGEVLCDGRCGGICDPENCGCAGKNECETEVLSTLSEDVLDAADNQRMRMDKLFGPSYSSAHEGYSWIKQALEDASANDKNISDLMKTLWENVKSGDTYSAGVLARGLADKAADTAERYIRLAACAGKTADRCDMAEKGEK